jgi:hypothetical protein
MITGGTSVTFLKRRLAEVGRADLLQAVEGGVISAYAAAEAAGLITRRPVQGNGNAGLAKRRQHLLRKLEQSGPDPAAAAMELILGPGVMGSVFRTHEEVRQAWEEHREALLQRASPGKRPQAWWALDAPGLGLKWPGLDTERSYLWRAGVLDEEEKHRLEAEWRREFEHAQTPDFAIAQAWPKPLLEGIRARRAHYRWADIPHELVEQWTKERRRRRAPG